MHSFLIIAALIAFTAEASAEIMCTETGGCWETGKRIRLLNSAYRGVDTTLAKRDGTGRQDIRGIPIANDTPHQTYSPPQRRR
jgi:hypothetical protein